MDLAPACGYRPGACRLDLLDRNRANAPPRRRPKAACALDVVLRSGMSFSAFRARFTHPRTGRTTLLGAHDPARDSDVGLGAITGTGASPRSISLGFAEALAGEDCRLV